ncbi:hypothetical protein PZH41_07380 [Phocaeicola vulgatus]|uniref:hypothetical protein n=2 Tax=Phocaeicola vulgatus TaxID=821 RepID=UPI0023B0C630|nr:hypothetical protein [Phocaeicola vulgatus]MDE8709238.1 hypothetical protein [Phocaeicola vulgatus]
MSDLNLENIVGFKAVDKNGNERQVTVDEMTELVSARIVSAASEISTFAAAAAAGTDEFEDQLPQSDTFSWLRTLDGSKNPTLTSSSAAAKVLGELIPLATNEVNGLMSKNNYIKIAQSITSTKLIKIESWDGYSTLVFIRTSGSTGLYSIDGNWADSAKFTRLSGPLGKDHFNAYRERNGNIYVKTTTQSEPLTVTSVGSNHVFKFEESDKDVDSLIVLQ